MPTTEWILEQRGAKNSVDPYVPYFCLLEEEPSAQAYTAQAYTAQGYTARATESPPLEQVLTIFLTNRECPYRCTMCDLWKNTTDETVPLGAIPAQIDFALKRFGSADVVKLYNSGNFFDRQAIPREDWEPIARRVSGFRRVVVETHPRMLKGVEEFAGMIAPATLEVAMGLETVHPEVLPKLNKQMTLVDFQNAAERLVAAEIAVRAFILLQPPWIDATSAREWAIKSIEFAFGVGVQCCSIVPTRDGNGAMEALESAGQFHSPTLRSMETVLSDGLSGLNDGLPLERKRRVFMDTWDVERFNTCVDCDGQRIRQIHAMNLHQIALAPIECRKCQSR